MEQHSLLAARTEEEKYRALLESAPDAMIIADEQGQIVFINAQTEKLFGYERRELLGNSIDALVPKRLQATHVHHRASYAREPRLRPMGAGLDLFALRKDGTEFPVEISLSPIKTPEGTLISAVIRDITERHRFQQALQQKNDELEDANRAKDWFLAGMSHELRTPLNAIIGFTGTLLMKLPGPLTEEQHKQLSIIQTSARHLLSLINDILDLAKIETGKVELNLQPVVVQEVVEQVDAALHSLATRKGLEIHLKLPREPLTVLTDRRSLHQILINLANNAIKYTLTGGVTIEVIQRATEVEIAVLDTGVGIKSEDQTRLFAAFEQLDPSNTRRFEGAGLGLYLSQKLATMLGGKLSFSSTFGSGSRFALTLERSA